MSPGTPPRVTPEVPPRVSSNAQRCAIQSATSREPAYHPGLYGLLTRVSLGAPRVVARNATDRWLECWRAARAHSVADDVAADVVVVADVIVVVVVVVDIICRKRCDAWY